MGTSRCPLLGNTTHVEIHRNPPALRYSLELAGLLHFEDPRNAASFAKVACKSFAPTPPPARSQSENHFEVWSCAFGLCLYLLTINTVGLFAAGCAGSTAAKASTPPQIVVPPASQTVTVGQTAAFSVTATGAAPLSYQWNKNSAAISGATSATYTTPPTSADNGSQFDVAVSNSAGRVKSTTVTLTVTSARGVTTTSGSLPNGTVQTAYSATLQASGGTTPYTWSVASGSLPAGLNLAVAGTISGTPTTAGTASFTIQVTDSGANKALAGFAITANNGTGGGTIPQFTHVFIV